MNSNTLKRVAALCVVALAVVGMKACAGDFSGKPSAYLYTDGLQRPSK